MLGKSPALICARLVFLNLDQKQRFLNLILFTKREQANVYIN